MNACVIVGSVWPTFSVPGISRSGTILKNLKIAVVGANDPMPSVSKKLVTKPVPSSSALSRGLALVTALHQIDDVERRERAERRRATRRAA